MVATKTSLSTGCSNSRRKRASLLALSEETRDSFLVRLNIFLHRSRGLRKSMPRTRSRKPPPQGEIAHKNDNAERNPAAVNPDSPLPAAQSTSPQAPDRPLEEKRPERVSPPNHVYIGKKPVMSYAMSALIQLAQSGEIVIKARGMVISRAVDVAEIVTERLGNNAYEPKQITIGTERVELGEDARNVSTIEITIGRK